MSPLPYAQVRARITTGSLVLFDGDGLVSGLIKAGSGGKSHCALAIRGADFAVMFPEQVADQGLDPQRILCWESTKYFGTRGRGVQTSYLSDRLAAYDGQVSVRTLTRAPTPGELTALATMHALLRGVPYEQAVLELICAAYDGPGGQNTPDLSSVFCSELVAAAWQAMGYLYPPPTGQPANEYTPSDLGNLACLRGTQTIGPEVPISIDN